MTQKIAHNNISILLTQSADPSQFLSYTQGRQHCEVIYRIEVDSEVGIDLAFKVGLLLPDGNNASGTNVNGCHICLSNRQLYRRICSKCNMLRHSAEPISTFYINNLYYTG